MAATYQWAVPPTGFVQGINIGGPAVTIEGNTWLSHEEAAASGLTLTGVGSALDLACDFPITPEPDLDTLTMLQTLCYHQGTGSYTMNLPLPNGFYELYFWSIENYTDNFRAMDVAIEEGVTVATDIGRPPRGEWRKHGPYQTALNDHELTSLVWLKFSYTPRKKRGQPDRASTKNNRFNVNYHVSIISARRKGMSSCCW